MFLFNQENSILQKKYQKMEGLVTKIEPYILGEEEIEGCIALIWMEDYDGNIISFVVTPFTFVIDFFTVEVGMEITVFYKSNFPINTLGLPQYSASVIAGELRGRTVSVGHFNHTYLNEDHTLQLNMDESVPVRTNNNQMYFGSVVNQDLVVIYSISTRSIPAQTTPDQIYVLCASGYL